MLIYYAQLHALMCASVTQFNLVLEFSHAFNGGVINLLQSSETLMTFRREEAHMEQTVKLVFASES
jgi:hypothetical protein